MSLAIYTKKLKAFKNDVLICFARYRGGSGSAVDTLSDIFYFYDIYNNQNIADMMSTLLTNFDEISKNKNLDYSLRTSVKRLVKDINEEIERINTTKKEQEK